MGRTGHPAEFRREALDLLDVDAVSPVRRTISTSTRGSTTRVARTGSGASCGLRSRPMTLGSTTA